MTPLQRYIEPELLRRLSLLTLSARTLAAGMASGRHRAPVRGSSIEFRQHRGYTPGDEPRRIDWRVLARTDRPFVREYEQETKLRCLIAVDASGSMSYGSGRSRKIDHARRLAAALSYVMLSQDESVGLATFGATSHFLPAHSGRGQLSRVLLALDRTTPGGAAPAGTACAAIARRLTRRSLVLLISDALLPPEELGRGLAALRHDRHEVAVLRVMHRDEMTFPFSRWQRLVGTEGEAYRTVDPASARDMYLERFGAHARRLRQVCSPLSVAVRDVPTDEDVGDAVVGLIHRR
jgi:uncharacterized protein (DUF58 family)